MTSLYPLLFPASFLLMLVIERFVEGRPQPHVRGWLPKALVFFVFAGALNATVGSAVAGLLRRHTVFDLSGLGTALGAVVGVLATTFVAYWLHRTWHRFSALWRWTHQMHHSAERVDVAGFAYGHPFELVLATSVIPAAGIALGLSTHAAMLAGYMAFMHNLFTHLNVRTPRWLGYIVQRPEMHAVHHERGVHAYNYGLPLWDRMFGTLRNPVTWQGEVGFWDGASRKVGAMLIGRDVATPQSHQAGNALARPSRASDLGCGSHPDHAATRTDFRSGRSVSTIASPQRSLVASARS